MRSEDPAVSSSLGIDGPRTCSAAATVIPVRSLVSVVDDDESVRESLPELLRVCGFTAQAFASAEEFLASAFLGPTRCLILDVAMPGMTGPDLQAELRRRRREIPIVYVTARHDETLRPRMLEQGAVECLFKPINELALLNAVTTALGIGSFESAPDVDSP